MSARATEEDISSDDVEANAVRECNMEQYSEEISQRDDDIAVLIKDCVIGDLVSPPVLKLPAEILAEIFVQSIPPLIPGGPGQPCISSKNGMHPQQLRARLAQVCRTWSAVLDDESRVWATLVLNDSLPAPEIVSSWIKKSKSRPLDVFIRPRFWYPYQQQQESHSILTILHRELWRIRCFIAEIFAPMEMSALFTPGFSTDAPMMQTLALHRTVDGIDGDFGGIHCPALRALTISYFGDAVKSLIVKPMQSVHHLNVTILDGPITLYLKLLDALPNLVSLSWNDFGGPIHAELPKVVLERLKSLSLKSFRHSSTTRFLACPHVPSLEYLDFEHDTDVPLVPERILNGALDAICRDGTVRLRHLALRRTALRGPKIHAMLHHLKHLEYLIIADQVRSPDDMLLALSHPNQDFVFACPQLKTVEISSVYISTVRFVDFVQRRVQSDSEDPAPSLVTCLKLSYIKGVDKELRARLVKTHSSSIQIVQIRR